MSSTQDCPLLLQPRVKSHVNSDKEPEIVRLAASKYFFFLCIRRMQLLAQWQDLLQRGQLWVTKQKERVENLPLDYVTSLPLPQQWGTSWSVHLSVTVQSLRANSCISLSERINSIRKTISYYFGLSPRSSCFEAKGLAIILLCLDLQT